MLMEPWNIEVLAEVAQWRAGLRTPQVDAAIDLLAERGELLPYPYSSHLVGRLRELRIQFRGEKDRVSYYPAKRRRIVLLTVFRKQRRRESAEIERARRAMEAHKENDR
jgi:hypothetical protein